MLYTVLAVVLFVLRKPNPLEKGFFYLVKYVKLLAIFYILLLRIQVTFTF